MSSSMPSPSSSSQQQAPRKSSSGAAPGGVEREDCPLAKKLPLPKRTSNYVQDSNAELQHEQFKFIINHLTWDPAHISPLHGVLTKRLACRDDMNMSEEFKNVSTFAKLPDEFVLGYLESISDLSMSNLIHAMKFDAEAATQLLVMDQQIASTTKIPKEGLVREVMAKLLRKRSHDCGSRLAKLKANGDLKPSGRIGYTKVGSYRLFFEGDRLAEVSFGTKDLGRLFHWR